MQRALVRKIPPSVTAKSGVGALKGAPTGDYAVARKRMVLELQGRGIREARVLEAMLKVPRHCFVEEAMRPMAYLDRPLKIGQGQTISQPFIVARMLEALQLAASHRVLEVGTGCGYQTALLAEQVGQVYSIERISALLMGARMVLKRLSYRNVHLKLGDGTLGWPDHAPFDAIVVAAAGPRIPQPYLEQLADGGRLILPVGDEKSQKLIQVTRRGRNFRQEVLSGCRFVQLRGRYGFAAG